jgi:hypothetical protein
VSYVLLQHKKCTSYKGKFIGFVNVSFFSDFDENVTLPSKHDDKQDVKLLSNPKQNFRREN